MKDGVCRVGNQKQSQKTVPSCQRRTRHMFLGSFGTCGIYSRWQSMSNQLTCSQRPFPVMCTTKYHDLNSERSERWWWWHDGEGRNTRWWWVCSLLVARIKALPVGFKDFAALFLHCQKAVRRRDVCKVVVSDGEMKRRDGDRGTRFPLLSFQPHPPTSQRVMYQWTGVGGWRSETHKFRVQLVTAAP